MHLRRVQVFSVAGAILVATSTCIFFFFQQSHKSQHAVDTSGLPTQAQRAAALAMIPEQGTNLYALPNSPDSHFQNMTHMPQANSSVISSMIVHLNPVSLPNAPANILNLPDLTADHVPIISDVEHPVTVDPLQLALQMQPADSQLINWLQHWHNDFAAGKALDDADRSNLADILTHTPLTWLQIYYLGEAFDHTTGDDSTTAVFYLEVVYRAHQSFSKFAPGAPEIRPALLAMHKVKNILWIVTANDFNTVLGRHTLQAEWILNNDLIKYIKPSDPVLELALQHGKIGIIEYYYAIHQTDKAFAFGQSIDLSQMTEDERAEVALRISDALLIEHRYREATAQLKIVVQDTQSKYYQDAVQELNMITDQHSN